MHTLEMTQKLLTHESDAFGLWRPDAIFRLMQEIAGAHSRQIGYSREELLEKGLVWMIARVKLNVHRYPKLYDDVHAKTWYGSPGRITYPRYIAIRDADGLPLADMATSWVVVDTSDRRILLPSKVGLDFPSPADIPAPIQEPTKLRLEKRGVKRTILRTPQYSDLDVNGHMNNASYVSWILDLFPLSFHRGHRIKSLCVSYSNEAKPDEQVEISLFTEGSAFEILGVDKADGHVVFEAQGGWTDV